MQRNRIQSMSNTSPCIAPFHLLMENAISSLKPLIAGTWHADRGHSTVRKTSIYPLSTGGKITFQWQACFLVLHFKIRVNVNVCLSLYVCPIISWKLVRAATCLLPEGSCDELQPLVALLKETLVEGGSTAGSYVSDSGYDALTLKGLDNHNIY